MKRLMDELRELTPAQAGAAGGLGISLLLVIFGFWKSLLVLLFTVTGYYIGKKFFSDKDQLKEFLDRIFPPGRFR